MFLWHIGGLQRKTSVFKGQRFNSVLCYRRLPFFLTRPRTALTPSLQTRPCNHCIHRNLTGPIAVKSSFIFRRPCSQCLIPQPLVSTWWNPMTVHEGPEWRVYIFPRNSLIWATDPWPVTALDLVLSPIEIYPGHFFLIPRHTTKPNCHKKSIHNLIIYLPSVEPVPV